MGKKPILPKWLTSVTPLSKAIALLMFILLPFLGFLLGIKYCKTGDFNIFDIGVSKCGTPPYPITPTKSTLENKVEKVKKTDGTIEVNLTLVGKIENLNVTNIEMPYRYKIILDKPITDKDAISDARGEDIPKTEYVLLSSDEEILYKLNDSVNKKVLLTGILEWGLAETRHLKVTSVTLL